MNKFDKIVNPDGTVTHLTEDEYKAVIAKQIKTSIRQDGLFKMAIESGLCDADLSNDNQLITDYGDATEAIQKFAAMIESKVRAESSWRDMDSAPKDGTEVDIWVESPSYPEGIRLTNMKRKLVGGRILYSAEVTETNPNGGDQNQVAKYWRYPPPAPKE